MLVINDADDGLPRDNQAVWNGTLDDYQNTSVFGTLTLRNSPVVSYQWESSADNSIWNAISGATSSIYDAPAVSSTTYFRRKATDGSNSVYSPSITVTVSGSSGEWLGFSSDWNDPSNWCGGVPTNTTNVIIPPTVNDPVISSSSQVQDLTIQSGASLTISSNILHIHGDVINNGSFTDSANTVKLIGAGDQEVSGKVSFHNLIVEKNTGGLALNDTVTVNGILTLSLGTLTTNGYLIVNLNTGAIDGAGTGNISGTITTTKTITSDKYHMISSSLSGCTMADWNDDVQIKGGHYANCFTYDETNADTVVINGWTSIASLSAPLSPLQGFCLYFYGSRVLDETGTYTHNATYNSPVLTNTVSSTGGVERPDSDGWNLMGNPYPSALDWAGAGWTKTGIDDAIYFWDPTRSRYAAYVEGSGINGGTQYIPSMQAFWVKVTTPGGTGSLAVNNSARVTSANPAVWKLAANHNILKLTAGSEGYSDETIIRFRDDASEGFDSQLDAYKMKNEDKTPSLYSVTSDVDYSINSLPENLNQVIIPVNLDAGFTGNYIFTAEATGGFENGSTIIFEDRLLGISQDLRSNPTYVCQVEKGNISDRFYINYKRTAATGLNTISNAAGISVSSHSSAIDIEFKGSMVSSATIGVFNALGEKVFFAGNASVSSGKYSILLPSASAGIYLVKIETSDMVEAKKVYLLK